jgi:hypothetical protein
MAAISLQPGAVFQETPAIAPARQSATNTTPVNPNQAQGAPVPQDTVTLAGQPAPGQQPQQDPQQQPPFQETILFAAGAQIIAPGNDGAANATAQQTPAPSANAQATAPTQQQDPAAIAPATGNAANAAQTPEQELQELDQTLQQLGINPQSISLFNRLALLLYANDPAALQQFVQQLQQGAQEVGQGAGAAVVESQNQPQVQNATPPQNQGAVSGQAPTPNGNQTQAAPTSGIFAQFEELQITLGALGGQTQSSSTNGGNSSSPNLYQDGTSLNVTA